MGDLLGLIRLDFRSDVPIYLQLVAQIERLVAQGELQTGTQLPTVRELATELRINFNTVARAYRLLDEIGLISTQRGRGTYIWEPPSAETAQKIKQHQVEELARRFVENGRSLGYSDPEIRKFIENALNEGSSDKDNEGKEHD